MFVCEGEKERGRMKTEGEMLTLLSCMVQIFPALCVCVFALIFCLSYVYILCPGVLNFYVAKPNDICFFPQLFCSLLLSL